MSTLNILLLTVLCALALACIVGVAVGKYQVKKAAGNIRGLLSARERAIYAACVVLGTILLLVGVFYEGPAPRHDEWDFMDPDAPFAEDWHEEWPYDDVIMEAPAVMAPRTIG